MSSSAFLDKPLLKVSRPVAACSRCRTAKIKCDGRLPACSACERVGKASSCSGASDEFAKGKERSYVASLEGYCEKLESEIGALQHRKTMASANAAGVPQESSITSISSTGTVAESHHREVSDIDDLVGDFGFLSVNATSRDFRGITSSTSFANLLLSVAVVESLSGISPQPLPPRHEATPLLQFYFDNIFTQLPFFVETSFWTAVDSVYEPGGRFAKPFDHFTVRMVLAIALATISYQSDDKNQRRSLALVISALEFSEDVLHPGSVVGIQSILLLVQYSLINPMRFRSWYLVGMAVRVMVDLGLHQDPPEEVLSNTERLSIRQCVFHCLYCLDRGVSTALGRPFSFSDASVDVALPAASTSLGSSLTEHSHVFQRSTEPGLYLVKIRQIMSLAYQEMYFSGREPSAQPLPSIWARCAEAQEWFDRAPTNVPRHFPVLYRLEFLYTTVIILSPSHKYPTLSDFNKVVLFDRCMDYISQLHQALENPNILPFMTLVDIQRAYQVGRRFVDLLSQDSGLLLRPSVPAAPPVPHGTPGPPFVSSEGRTNYPARAIRSLTYAQNLLRYSARKWAVYSFLEQFDRAAAPVRKWLTQPSAMFLHTGPAAFMAGPTTSGGSITATAPTTTATTMSGGHHHPGFHYGPF